MVNLNRFEANMLQIAFDYVIIEYGVLLVLYDICFMLVCQNISYIAEHVVGTGSFGVVFQVSIRGM